MPLLRVKVVRAMSIEDRRKKLLELRAELTRLETMVHAGGTIENPARIRELRKAVARVLTINNEKVAPKEEQK